MGLSLQEIGTVLSYDDPAEIVAFLEEAEAKLDEQIEELKLGKEKIKLARADYEKKLKLPKPSDDVTEKHIPEREILLSDSQEELTLDTLWDYLRPFYEKIPKSLRKKIVFANQAGIYMSYGKEPRIFAVCEQSAKWDQLFCLPAANYLCAQCDAESRDDCRRLLEREAEKRTGSHPPFAVELVDITGILRWKYRIEMPLL